LLIATWASVGCAGHGSVAEIPRLTGDVNVEMAPTIEGVRTGFEGIGVHDEWRAGDQVTYALTLRDADEIRHTIFEVTILGWRSGSVGLRLGSSDGDEVWRVTSDLIACLVRRLTWDGSDPSTVREEGVRVSRIPDGALKNGLHEYMQVYDVDKPLESQTESAELGWMFAMLGMRNLLEAGEHEGRIIRSLVRTPGLWSVVTHLGVIVDIGFVEEESPGKPVKVQLGDATLEGVRVGLVLSMNGRQALVGSVVAVPVKSPLGPANGVVLVEAVRPGDPSRSATLRLIGAGWSDIGDSGLFDLDKRRFGPEQAIDRSVTEEFMGGHDH
jgi:hypothetical protein